MNRFVGRIEEIETLLQSFNSSKGTLNVIKGRRRIGKSTLIKELPIRDSKVTLRYLTSPPPKKEVSDDEERIAYAEQVKREFSLPYTPPHETWAALIYFIVSQCNKPYTILAIDEVNWLARKSSVSLEQVLWEVWERECAHKSNFMMILSGSLASWMEKNIIASEGFVGRISVNMVLRELPLNNVCELFGAGYKKLPDRDIIKLLCAFGGVPLYLNHINPNLTAEDNLLKLAFKKTGAFNNEFNQMFNELFSDDNKKYRGILEAVGTSRSAMTAREIAEKIKRHYTGRINQALSDLCEVGFLKQEHTWNTKTTKFGRAAKYKIADNYTAFFFRSISKQNEVVERTKRESVPDNLASILGLQFENLVSNNTYYILEKLNIINPVFVGGYFQTKTQRQDGCQIDLLIQTKHRLYVCECKMLAGKVQKNIIKEVEQKVAKLTYDSTLTVCPVLIHANGVVDSVAKENYFNHIIDMSGALKA
ncbi:hypothetical protein L3Q72_20475 [Vibrio sp. JC009]|uniref:AAA family ATPase n=1 Tax=Vibrio sp. JC009 TaxID=2912314 RepID=UPI0023AFDBAE|nr:hypothetical protein [Vibrio sp. JC009]WED23613.1 hypothetical protein L3Q72_20475 [Vibrio sp. JC009]